MPAKSNVFYLMALEGGGTRSQAILLDSSGQVLGSGRASDVNTNFVPYELAQQAVQLAVKAALDGAGILGSEVKHFAAALVGPRFGPETFGELCPNTHYHYYGERDVVFARAQLYRPHGVAVVAATGATAWAVRQDDGRQTAFGGWGSLLGDEGSAYAVGLQGLRQAVRAFEGRLDVQTDLVAAIAAHLELKLENFHRGLITLAYSKPLSRSEIAGLAPVVSQLAQQGDLAAARIIAEAAQDLANLAIHAARSLFSRDELFSVALAGGLFKAGESFTNPITARFAADYPEAEILLGQQDPAVALGMLALSNLEKE
jgi:N-acetylglucosamine kinase-like BadF-type ATPase